MIARRLCRGHVRTGGMSGLVSIAQAPGHLCELAHSFKERRGLPSDHQQRMRRELAMSNILLAAERAVWAVDAFLTRAVLFAWTCTLRHHVDFGGTSDWFTRPQPRA
jgi:hypothetical protein